MKGRCLFDLTVLATLIASSSAYALDAQSHTLNPLSQSEAAKLSGFRGRPLFSPSRRPPLSKSVEPALLQEPVASQPNLRLSGIIENAEESVAVVQDVGTGQTFQLRLGDQVGGWLVTVIEPTAMSLTLGEREENYRLFASP